jgi:hypothetical protein
MLVPRTLEAKVHVRRNQGSGIERGSLSHAAAQLVHAKDGIHHVMQMDCSIALACLVFERYPPGVNTVAKLS